MCLEITLSAAAVARGFASYLATLFGLAPSALRVSVGPVQLDPAAVLLIALLTAILIKGTRESSLFNIGAGAGRRLWRWLAPLLAPLHSPGASLPASETCRAHRHAWPSCCLPVVRLQSCRR